MDPAEQFMKSLLTSGPNDSVLQAQSGAFGASDHGSQVGDKSDYDEDEDIDNIPGVVVDPELVGAGPAASSVQVQHIAETCRQLKLRKHFSPESEADLDVFAVSAPLCYYYSVDLEYPLEWAFHRGPLGYSSCGDPRKS
jgi:hypothetical protein